MSTKYEQILQAAIRSGYLHEERPLAAFVDTTSLAETIAALHRAFPAHFTHAFAAKANPMSQALAFVKLHGMGCEVASPGELEQALRAGFEPGQIVYDEPAKTVGMLRKVLELGMGLNIDNFQEFSRVQSLMRQGGSRSRIGFRINPQVGAGSISAMSTATTTSKFGVALEDEGNRGELLRAYLEHPWLTALHSHVGSQGCSLDLMTAGIRKLVDLAGEINSSAGRRQVEVIDIGGGLPVNFESEAVRPTFTEFAAVLRDTVPELFSGEYLAKTEFGRSVFAKNGFIVSRVEYTKRSGGRRIAITHAGAQIATRTVFMPDHWKLRLSVFDSEGRAKNGPEAEQDVAGPLCFAGDLVASARRLPVIEPGDYVVLHDTGAYYFSNPFYYNALCAPAVYAAANTGANEWILTVWRQQQSLDAMLSAIG